MVPVFKNIEERSAAKNYRAVSILSAVSKVFEKLVNNRIVDHLEKCDFSSDFQYGFRSSRSTPDLLAVVSDRIARTFTGLGLLNLWHLINPRLLTGFGMLVFFTNVSLKEYQVRYLVLFLFFLSNRRLRVVLDGKPSQEYPVNAGVLQGSILGPTLSLLYINDLPDDVICKIAIHADDTALYSKCDQASDLWQQLELA